MEGVIKADDARPVRVVAGDLDNMLHRLGAGVDEQRLSLPPAGHKLLEPFGQHDLRLAHHHVEAGVGVPFRPAAQLGSLHWGETALQLAGPPAIGAIRRLSGR